MYWLRVAPLKRDLAGAGLAERERFKYLLAWGIASTFEASIVPHELSPRAGLIWLLTLLITVVTVVRAYRCNGGREGSAILDRYLSLGWVVSLRAWIIVAVLQHLLPHALDALGYAAPDEEGPTTLDAVLILCGGAWIAWALGRHLRDVRSASPATVSGAPYGPAEGASEARGRAGPRLERFVQSVERREALAAGAVARRPRRSALRLLRRRRR